MRRLGGKGAAPPAGQSAGPVAAELVRLALPITATRLGITLMLVADNIVLGHYGTDALAVYGLSLMIVHTVQNIGVGLLMGGLIEISSAVGRREFGAAGSAFRRSLAYAVAIGLAGLVVSVALRPLFTASSLSPELVAEAGRVAVILGASLVPMLVLLASVMLFEALGRPLVAFVVLLGGNAVNIALDLVLVFGLWGPALGAEGAAWATLLARTAMAVAALFYIIRLMPERMALGRPTLAEHAWSAGRSQRRLGTAEGVSMGIESGSFAAMTLFASRMGAVELAAYSILVNIMMVLFTVAVGIGSAVAVSVARAHGAASAATMALVARTGFSLFVGLTLVVALAMLLWSDGVTRLYTGDPALAAVAAPLVGILGFVFLVDGAQRVVGNALRGYGEAWWPTLSHLFSYVVVMIPLGFALGLVMGLGTAGLLGAIAVASVVASGLLMSRFVWLSGRFGVAAAPGTGTG